MGKKLLITFTVLASLFVFSFSSFAEPSVSDSKTSINNVDIKIRLDNRGTAYVTEKWDINVVNGTVWYSSHEDLGDTKISDFSLSEMGSKYKKVKTYDDLHYWGTECGMFKTKNGSVEFAWSIQNPGRHIFTLKYNMTDFVKQFSDSNGFNQRLVNDRMTTEPKHIKITIYKKGCEFTTKDTRAWAYGFKGNVNITNGKVIAESTEPFKYSNYANLMVCFNSDMFTPTSQKTNQSFAEFKEKTFKDINYNYIYIIQTEPQRTGLSRFFPLVFILVIVLCALVFILRKIKKNKINESDLNNFSDTPLDTPLNIPLKGNLTATYYMLNFVGEKIPDNALISAYLLRWIQNEVIHIKKSKVDSQQLSIIFLNENPIFSDKTEIALYDLLKNATDKNSVLSEHKLKIYVKNNYKEIDSWYEQAEISGAQNLESISMRKSSNKPTPVGLIQSEKMVLSESEEVIAAEMIRFKKYLEDLSENIDIQVTDTQILNDYLVLAVLFGFADTLAQKIKENYPLFNEAKINTYISYDDIFKILDLINDISKVIVTGTNEGKIKEKTEKEESSELELTCSKEEQSEESSAFKD